MKLASMFAATAIATVMSTNAFALVDLGPIPPTASFSNTVVGSFSDTWQFTLGSPSVVAASLTNVQVTFGSLSVGGIEDFAASLNGTPLLLSTLSSSVPPITVTTQVLAGSTTFAAGTYVLTVTGNVIGGATASYGGNIVAAPVPEPESYAMLLAGLGVMGAIAVRRNKSKKQD